MWNLIRVTGKNIFSYNDIDYTFLQNKCTLIYGKNETDPGTDSNGSGKSTIIELITLLITGATCRDVDKEEFINDESDSMYGELFMENKVLKKTLSIKRTFYRGGKSSLVSLMEDGEVNNNITSVNEANKRILELIGISREDLMNYFIIGQGSTHSFFAAGDSEKKEIINRLTNADILYKIIKDNDNRKQKLEFIEKTDIETKISNLELKIQNKQDSIEHERNNFAKDKEERIKSLEEDSKEIDTDIVKNESDLLVLSKQKEDAEKALKACKLGLISNLDKQLLSVKESLNDLNEERDDLGQLKSGLNRVIDEGITCPRCKYKFSPNYDLTPNEAKGELKVLEGLIDKNSLEIKTIQDKLSVLKKQELINEEIQKEIRRQNMKLSDISDDKRNKDLKIAKNKTKKAENLKKIEEIKEELKKPSKLNTLKEELAALASQLELLDAKLVEKEAEMEMVNFWKHHLSKKGFLTFLANKAIKSIEGITNFYLKRFDTNFSVLINGYTELKSKEIREKIEIFVQNKGLNKKRFGRFSGGEKGRIDLAGIVGIQKLINISCNGGGLNFLVLDEKFDGLDSSGQHQIISILQNIGITTIVISHRNNSIGAENELVVEKVDGVSSILSVSNN